MEYNQNYENDLNILIKQLNKISLEKRYEKFIEPYKNSPALVKMLYKKNEHLFEEYKDTPELESENKNLLESLNKNQIENLLKMLKVIKDPNEIKNIVNPDNDYIYNQGMALNISDPYSIDNIASRFILEIQNKNQRLAIKGIILEIAEKSYPDIIKDIYPNSNNENSKEYISKNYEKLISEEMNYSERNKTGLEFELDLSPRSKTVLDLIKEQDKSSLGVRMDKIKEIVNREQIENNTGTKNKLK